MGTCLSNKYSEGLPFKRYYSGNEFVDNVEQLAVERAKKLFQAEHANVQPHSGSQANQAAYLAILKPRDKVLAMRIDQGGHLSHGDKVNFSGQYYNFFHYGVRQDTGVIDYNEVEAKAKEIKPKMIICGASAYPRIIDFKKFREIADKVGAYLMSDIAHIAGLVAGGVHPHPFPHSDIVTTTTHKTLRGPRGGLILSKTDDLLDGLCFPLSHKQGAKQQSSSDESAKRRRNLAQKIDFAVFPGLQGGPLENVIAAKAVCFKEAMETKFIKYQQQIVKNAKALAQTLLDEEFDLISNGTDNHLVLVDISKTKVGGRQAQIVLEEVGISINKNLIPFDKRGAIDPSGIRLGTPALTTRGMKEKEMKIIGQIISQVIKNINSVKIKKEAARKVKELTKRFPYYLR
jgi:glycine hydroxymethyltransferase